MIVDLKDMSGYSTEYLSLKSINDVRKFEANSIKMSIFTAY